MVNRTSTLLAAAALLATLAACSNGDDTSADNPASTPPPSSAGVTPTETPSLTPTVQPTTPTPKPLPTPKPTPAAPKAADGNNLKACADAVCEVYVKTGSRVPVKRSVAGFSTLVVTKVSASGVDFGGSTANTSVSAGGQQAGFTFRLNNLKVTTVALTPPQAILRLRPA